MLKNNLNNSSPCQFAEETVAYLYGESDAIEKVKYEAHLESCSQCADELAGFGLVRSAVFDWRTKDFSALETPLIEIPKTHSQSSFALAVDSIESNSWFGGFRNLFSLNPAMAALAVLMIGAGIAFYTFNFSGENEIARNNNDKNLVQPIVSPTVELDKKALAADDKVISPDKSPSVARNDSMQEMKLEKQTAPNKSIVKVSGGAPKNNSDKTVRAVKESNENIKKTSPVRKQPISNLNGAEDEEDESIRLADLFAELDTK